MSNTRKLRACYLRWAKNAQGTSDTDIDFSIKVDAFIEELKAAQESGLTDTNGWLNLRICENAQPEGQGKYSHKVRILL